MDGGLVWTKGGSEHRWRGSPPGQWAWAEITRMSRSRDGTVDTITHRWWELRLIRGRQHIGDFETAEAAMRYADSLWDAQTPAFDAPTCP